MATVRGSPTAVGRRRVEFDVGALQQLDHEDDGAELHAEAEEKREGEGGEAGVGDVRGGAGFGGVAEAGVFFGTGK